METSFIKKSDMHTSCPGDHDTSNLKIAPVIKFLDDAEDMISPLASTTSVSVGSPAHALQHEGLQGCRFFPRELQLRQQLITSAIEGGGNIDLKPALISITPSSSEISSCRSFTIEDLPVPTRVMPSRRRLGTTDSFSSKDSIELLAMINAIEDDDEDFSKENFHDTTFNKESTVIDEAQFTSERSKINRMKHKNNERPLVYLKNKLSKLTKQWDSLKLSDDSVTIVEHLSTDHYHDSNE
eukprot:CAMPEP_0194286622 /NCGR_PEP_ID=MMETSP0169-20130528/32898_1 /TAXON_ID=218684 /ORGANISM="Corethron pennatum, Strain L29A3" /LENGTH=239 /DNA_ID=CAMNT_0039033105 /DNA_START=196 /DNA_END=915 /DNA_ORIENTATION=+